MDSRLIFLHQFMLAKEGREFAGHPTIGSCRFKPERLFQENPGHYGLRGDEESDSGRN
jgi:hypothetical protein